MGDQSLKVELSEKCVSQPAPWTPTARKTWAGGSWGHPVIRKKRKIMMKIIKIIMLMLPIVVMPASSKAGWLIYHEPIFNGKILDIDTKQPIEGAVIVVEYNKATIGLGAGSISSIINLRETLTDKEGNFHIPSYSTFIQPFSWQIPATVIIFKPGYASLELGAIYFTGNQIQDKEGSWPWSKSQMSGHR